MGRSRYKIYEDDQPYFLTCTVVRWLPIFLHSNLTDLVLNSLSFLQKENRIVLYAYVIMENHLHLIAASHDLRKELRDFKSFTARSIIDTLKSEKANSLLRDLRNGKTHHKKDRQYQLLARGKPSADHSG